MEDFLASITFINWSIVSKLGFWHLIGIGFVTIIILYNFTRKKLPHPFNRISINKLTIALAIISYLLGKTDLISFSVISAGMLLGAFINLIINLLLYFVIELRPDLILMISKTGLISVRVKKENGDSKLYILKSDGNLKPYNKKYKVENLTELEKDKDIKLKYILR